MASELAPFLFYPGPYFEPLGRRLIQRTYLDRLEEWLPAGWRIFRDDVWLKVAPGSELGLPPLPAQGFKIHVSGTPQTAEELLAIVVPAMLGRGIQLKTVADPFLLQAASSKRSGRTAAGKFIVLYPPDLATFHEIVSELAPRTRHLDGAYILSDRRVEGSRVLFYRYGGFAARFSVKADGSRTAMIEAADGRLVADDRLPYFKLPGWVEDPFGGIRDVSASSRGGAAALGGRYEVTGSLAFSSSGGIYTAHDRTTGRKVVLKEARPLTGLWRAAGGYRDAVDLLRNEHELLLRLAHLPFVIQPIELFREWEHSFLAEEFFDGQPLNAFRAGEAVTLAPFARDRETLLSFCLTFKELAGRLISHVEAIHAAGVVLGDLSPGNILIDPQTLEVKLIDLESAFHESADADLKFLSSLWSTPGFRPTDGGQQRSAPTAENDFFALGRALASLLLPVAPLFSLAPAAEKRIFDKIAGAVALPLEVPAMLSRLAAGDAAGAQEILGGWDVEASVDGRAAEPEPEPSFAPRREEIERTLELLTAFIERTATPERDDRLWPSDVQLYSTNPLGLAFGACGTALFLQARGRLPPAAAEWMRQRPLSPGAVPAGLMNGLAGIAYAFDLLGWPDRADEALGQCFASPILTAESGFFDGVAGWGWACLAFHRRRGGRQFLDAALQAGRHLLAAAERDRDGSRWPRSDGGLRFGIAYGAAGIALFLLELHRASGGPEFLAAARGALQFERSQAFAGKRGPNFFRWQGDGQIQPYWLYGGAGVGAALVRLYELERRAEDLDFLRGIAREAFSRLTPQTGQLEGLAGIGEFLLDLHRATGEESFLGQAGDLADSILRFAIERPEGLAFPGRLCLKIANDWGTGGAGVGLFLQRLLRPAPRLFHDLEAAAAGF